MLAKVARQGVPRWRSSGEDSLLLLLLPPLSCFSCVRLCDRKTAGGVNSIPGQGTKILQAV